MGKSLYFSDFGISTYQELEKQMKMQKLGKSCRNNKRKVNEGQAE